MKLSTALIMSLFMSLTAFAQSNESLELEAKTLVSASVGKRLYFEMTGFQKIGNSVIVTISFIEEGVSCAQQVIFTQGADTVVSTKSCKI